MSNDQLGILLACLCCLVPWLVGFVTAWVLRLRVYQHGWKGAFIPHKLIERISIKIQEGE
jgi:hypothetical protein